MKPVSISELNAKENQSYKIEILHVRLSIHYFESQNIKIQIFSGISNDQFKAICIAELEDIRTAEKAGNITVHNPFKSRDIISLDQFGSYRQEEFDILLEDKFEESKDLRFIYKSDFIREELRNLDIHFKVQIERFVIFRQWRQFLEYWSQASNKTEAGRRSNESENTVNNIKKNERDHTQTLWFKVGLLFANGEMDKLRKKFSKGGVHNGTQIANSLGNINFKPYINETIQDTKTASDKNIFRNPSKVLKIGNYCIANSIEITDWFLVLYNKIKAES